MRPYVDPDPVPLAPVERLVEEGLMIAKQAVTMDVKNITLIRVLRDRDDLDPDRVARDVETELEQHAAEQEDYADRMTAELRDLDRRYDDSEHQHDYREPDAEALLRRRDVYRGLAAELRRLGEDDEFVRSIASTVQEELWRDVSSAIEARLEYTYRRSLEDDPQYLREREERMRTLREVDLELLARGRRVQQALEDLDSDW